MTKEEVFNIIVNHTLEIIPELEGHVFRYDDELSRLGANSIDRAEIVTMTMETLNLQIPRVELSGVNNMGQLAEVIYDKLQKN